MDAGPSPTKRSRRPVHGFAVCHQAILSSLQALLDLARTSIPLLGSGTAVPSPTSPQPPRPSAVSIIDWCTCNADRPFTQAASYRRFRPNDLSGAPVNPRNQNRQCVVPSEPLPKIRSPWPQPSLTRFCIELHARRALYACLRQGFSATEAFLRRLDCTASLWQAYFVRGTEDTTAGSELWRRYCQAYGAAFEGAIEICNNDCWLGLEALLELRAIVAPNCLASPSGSTSAVKPLASTDGLAALLECPEGAAALPSPAFQLAYLILVCPMLSREAVGKFLGGKGPPTITLVSSVTLYLADLLDFCGMDVGTAMRFYAAQVPIGGESQVIYRCMDAFARSYANARLRETCSDLRAFDIGVRVTFSSLLASRAERRLEKVPEGGVSRPEWAVMRDPQPPVSRSGRLLKRLKLTGGSSGDGSAGTTNPSDMPTYSAVVRPEDGGRRRNWFRRRLLSFGSRNEGDEDSRDPGESGVPTANRRIEPSPELIAALQGVGTAPGLESVSGGYITCRQGKLLMRDADIDGFTDGILVIAYALVMLNTSRHNEALVKKKNAQITKPTFKQMISAATKLRVSSTLLDQWFTSFCATPMEPAVSSVTEYYKFRPFQHTIFSPKQVSMARVLQPPPAMAVRLCGQRRTHSRYLWVDSRNDCLSWAGVVQGVASPTNKPESVDNLISRASVLTNDHEAEEGSVVTGFTTPRPAHKRGQTATPQTTASTPRSINATHSRHPTAPTITRQKSPKRSTENKSIELAAIKGFSLMSTIHVQHLTKSVDCETGSDGSRTLPRAMMAASREPSPYPLLQVISGKDESVEMTLSGVSDSEIHTWCAYLRQLISVNAARMSKTLTSPQPIPVDWDLWETVSKSLMNGWRDARKLIRASIREQVHATQGSEAWRLIEILAMLMNKAKDARIMDTLANEQFGAELIREVLRPTELQITDFSGQVIQRLAVEAAEQFPILWVPLRQQTRIGDRRLDPLELAVTLDKMGSGGIEVHISSTDALNVAKGATCAEFTTSNSGGIRISTLRPGRTKNETLSCLAACARLETSLIRRGLLKTPREVHIQLLAWLSLHLPYQRQIGLVIAAALVVVLEHNAAEFNEHNAFRFNDRLESRVPLNAAHWKEIGFDIWISVSAWYRSGFVTAVPAWSVGECLYKAVYEGFEEMALRIVWYRTMQDSAVLMGHQDLAYAYSMLRPALECLAG